MQKPLSNRSIQCPSCGGHTELKNRFVKLVVCGYCSQSLAMTGDGPVAQGKVAQLADLYTDLSLGAVGSIDGRAFAVQGRARFEWSGGFWDEWYLLFDDGTDGWLHEDEGELSLIAHHPDCGVQSLDAARVGSTFTVLGKDAYVKEKRTAKVAGAEGQLPRGLVQGGELRYVDAQAQGALFMLEEIDGEVELFTGRRLDDDALTVD